MNRKIFFSLFLSLFLISTSFFIANAASVSINGFAWSDTIGWIQMDPAFGGVSLDDVSGDFSGFAWSDNIGWVSFDASDGTHPSAIINNITTCGASCVVSGWARAISADGNGWDGWIKMSDTVAPAYSVNLDTTTGNFSGWAWGSDVVGWIDFSGVIWSSVPAPTYVISPSSVTRQIGQTQQFIGWYDPDGPGGPQVQQDQTASASWNSSNVVIATVNGSGLATCVSAGGPITITSIYSGITATASFTCSVSPVPLAPTGLTAAAGAGADCEKINLNWTDNSGDETRFEILRTGGGPNATYTVGAGVETYQDAAVAVGVNYTYQVRACNASGCSIYSNSASAVPVACAAIPTYMLTKDGDIFATINGGADTVSSPAIITVVPDPGFLDDVDLSVVSIAPMDPGFTFSFSDNTLSQAEYGIGSEFWVDVPGATPEDLYTITIQGDANGLLSQVAVLMNVTSADDDYWQW